MRTCLAVLTLSVLALSTMVAPSRAEILYPWCAQYNTKGGARNCGFVTWEQCRATVSGVGGYCVENPFYQAAVASGRAPRGSAAPIAVAPTQATQPERRTEWTAVSSASRTRPGADWCALKGRRGDPQLFLRQQARGCF